jgi:hypothetical protein
MVLTIEIVARSPLGWFQSIKTVGVDHFRWSKSIKSLAVHRSERVNSLGRPAQRHFAAV